MSRFCCFSGHRCLPEGSRPHIRQRLDDELRARADSGFTDFFTGGALGFDTLAAQAVLDLQAAYPDIRLHLALPFSGQPNRWPEPDRRIYESIKSRAFSVYLAGETYRPGCMDKRNRYMVDRSELLICWLTENRGGTAATVRYALHQGIDIINLAVEAKIRGKNMTTPFKTLPLEGLLNIRDLGGFPTADGRVTKYHRFIRSELPRHLTQRDVEFLCNYGLVMSVDFRGGAELRSAPSFLSAGNEWQRYCHNPLWNENVAPGTANKERQGTGAPPVADLLDMDWVPIYISIVENRKEWVKRCFELCAETDGCILYHCTTGKDRTGIFSAVLLGCCGVREADIVSDYSISMIHMKPVYAKMAGDPVFAMPEGVDMNKRFFQTLPSTMEGLLEHINKTYGTMRDYVLDCGVSPDTIEKLTNSMTEVIK
ncbi:MAG: DUF1273 family protein [Clostridiales bacterium]|nr:DUF1273 family protein [Clostridiales bacterium]